MADLSASDRKYLERAFAMSGGYVLDFSNASFDDFIYDSIRVDANNEQYLEEGTSKARRLRAIWKSNNNFVVGKLILDLLQYQKEHYSEFLYAEGVPERIIERCFIIGKTLKESGNGAEIDAIQPIEDSRDNLLLVNGIRDQINQGDPEGAVDRLHTYMVKYVRSLCLKHSVFFEKKETLNAIFGKYIKHLNSQDNIENVIVERILKYAISVLDSFNYVRNNMSLAHDNPKLLGRDESILIVDMCNSLIKFVNSLEEKIEKESIVIDSDDELPF